MISALAALGSGALNYLGLGGVAGMAGNALGWIGSNIGGLGSLVGGLGGAFGSLLGGSLSSKQQSKAAKSLARYQYQLQKKGLLEFPTVQRQGLINAGYNPMLALTNGSASFSGGAQSAGMPNIDIVGSSKQLSEVLKDIANEKAKREKELEELAIAGKELENKNLETQNKLQEANIRNIDADTNLKGSATTRTNVDVGTAIVNSLISLFGAGTSAYSAKAAKDAKDAITKTITTINHGDVKSGKSKEIIKSQRKAQPILTSSAKSVAAEVAKSLMLLTPASLSGAAVGAGMAPVRRREMEFHEKKAKDKSRKWYHNFDRLHFDY